MLDPKDALPARSTQSLQWRGVACDDGVPMHRIVFGCNRQGVTTYLPQAFSLHMAVMWGDPGPPLPDTMAICRVGSTAPLNVGAARACF